MINRRTTKKPRRETREKKGRDKVPKQNVGRNKVVGFVEVVFAWCFVMVRCDLA